MVTVHQLVKLFEANNVPEHYYSIGGLGGGECYGIEKIGGEWVVYYSERGRKTILQSHLSEDAACHQLLKLINEMIEEDFGRCLKLSQDLTGTDKG